MGTPEASERTQPDFSNITDQQLQEELLRRLAVRDTGSIASLIQQLAALRDSIQARADAAISTPASDEQIERTDWVKILKEKGKSFLMGKIDPNWMEASKGTKPIKGRQDSNFIDIGLFNLTPDQISVLRHHDSVMSASTAISYMGSIRDYQSYQNSHYLIIGNPIKGDTTLGFSLGLDPNSTWRALNHVMWAHRAYTSSNRSNHTPVESIILLPEHDADELIQQIPKNPDILEEIFQGIYPELTDRGLQRVQADQVKLVQAPPDVLNQNTQAAFYDNNKSKWNPLVYSRTIGEQPIDLMFKK